MREVLTQNDAEKLFKDYLGQFFHVFREEGSEVCDAYEKLNVSRETELNWIYDLISEKRSELDAVMHGHGREKYLKDQTDWSWTLLSDLIDMARNYPEIWPEITGVFEKHKSTITSKGRLIIAEHLMGSGYLAYGGPIFAVAENQNPELVIQLLNIAKTLLNNTESESVEARRLKNAQELWEKIRKRVDPGTPSIQRIWLNWKDRRALKTKLWKNNG